MNSERSQWLVPGTLLLVALAWIGGHFGDDAHGGTLELIVAIVHVIPVLVVAAALLIGAAGRSGPGWRRVLVAVAVLVKTVTVVAVLCGLTHSFDFGPRTLADWVPIGAANAGGGLILLAFIRGRRKALDSVLA